ncbi:TetR/AcrR family transcriptional regulator [Glycomyces algeriensis]|uniref:TetR family transcriptional regulator n=1 Tax=Glycomyces algeriensis TaxID=256037 RepID=A0A9W6LIC6_9ACTN|nr:TetR/AcrR family transcriptional regulator [Glycomyces algeriensis]MDA1368820.1 TetR/AcrR family transcriptional regulator [Glycomyces algeriensis]MDR7350836.1 TetR/AcrR family transcriptional repressor of nem operon [Glycomyces algeriensis]GLI43546.1 TetR family transcriptional regulator [Glycomyces algeriensis]
MGRPKNFDPDVAVAQAMETFWTKGYAGTSPADLAEATGVGKGSLYHAFGSKRELFGKALDRYGEGGSAMTEAYLNEPGTAKERIRAYLMRLIEVDLSLPAPRGCLAANTALELGAADPEAMRAVRRMTDETIRLFTERIRRGQREGDVAKDVDAQAQAQFLMNTIVGLRVMTQTHDGPVLHRIIDTAVAGL